MDPMVQFTVDAPWDHSSGYVPILDVQAKPITTQDGEQDVEYLFYEKGISNTKILMERSAMSTRVKMETTSNEVFRRIYNTDRKVDNEVKVEILNRYMVKMKMSGYNQSQRLQALLGGIRRYRKLELMERKGTRPLYRNYEKDWAERRRNKWEGRTNWFRKKRREGEIGMEEKRKVQMMDRKEGKGISITSR